MPSAVNIPSLWWSVPVRYYVYLDQLSLASLELDEHSSKHSGSIAEKGSVWAPEGEGSETCVCLRIGRADGNEGVSEARSRWVCPHPPTYPVAVPAGDAAFSTQPASAHMDPRF